MVRDSTRPLAVALVVLCLAGSSAFAQDPPAFLFSFGGSGTGPGQLNFPRSVAIHEDEIYVLDASNHRVAVFDLQGIYVRHWGEGGMEPHQLRNPQQLTVTPAGLVYITDGFEHTVQRFTSDGTYQFRWGGLGSANDQLNTPDGITFDADGDIWVVDRLNKALKEFDADGNFLSSVAGNPLVGATDVIPLPDNTFFATIWNTLYTGLRHLDASTNVLGQTAFVFQTPRGLSQAPNGDLYIVAGAPVHRTTIVNATTLEKVTEWGSFGTADDQFSAPSDVAVAPNGNVYIADSGNDVVKVFGTPVATPTTSWGRMKGRFGG